MATRPAGARIPVLHVHGSHKELGRRMGEFGQKQIERVVNAAKASFWDAEVSKAELASQIQPYVEAAERSYPGYLVELRAMADGADVPFDLLFRLNCYESRPPGTPPGSAAGPSPVFAPAPVEPAPETDVPVKDPGVLAGAPAADGCTSVVSRGSGTVIVGHTEDSSPEAVEGIYLLDATVEEAGEVRSRFLALNYAQTLPGCAAAMNRYGLIVLIDALPDPDRQIGAPRHFVSRALLDCRSIDEAVATLRDTARGGGWNYLLAQGDRYANVETTATRVVITASGDLPAYAHANHYLDGTLAGDSGDPRPNSLARLERARQLMQPDLSLDEMKALLSDRQGFPDSICRDRTIAALVADAAQHSIEVCWGEPAGATWTRYTL